MAQLAPLRMAALAFAAAPAACSAEPAADNGAAAEVSPRAQVERFIAADLWGRGGAGTGLLRTSFFDLNGDGRDEALAYVDGPERCGSGGCSLYVLTRSDGAWRLVTRTTVTWLPIRVLDNSEHGWRSLGVRVGGGGILGAPEIELAFDGAAYPSNPTVAPARPLPGGASGEPVIARGTPATLVTAEPPPQARPE